MSVTVQESPFIQLVSLINIALHNGKLSEYDVEKWNFEVIHKIAKYHSIEAMAYDALEICGFCLAQSDVYKKNEKLFESWKRERDKSTYKIAMLDMEREHILAFMENNGIWYMPLKGVILKQLYPKQEMRQMADNDILYDKKYQEEIYDFMIKNGYKAKSYKISNDDEYLKMPVYNFEMHGELFGDEHVLKWREYYSDVKERLIKDEDNKYGWHFSVDDFYIYLMVHTLKHYDLGGTGIRNLIDFYVYLKTYSKQMNWDYIKGQLYDLDADKFENDIRRLSIQLFAQTDEEGGNVNSVTLKLNGINFNSFTDEQLQQLKYLFGSGTYGTVENNVKNRLSDISEEVDDNTDLDRKHSVKVKYVFKRLFPGTKFFYKYYPWTEKHKWTLPFVWIYRLFRGIFLKRKKIESEIRALGKEKEV